MSVTIQFTQNFLGVEPECSQVCKFVKNFCPQLFGVCAAGVEVSCELVEVAAHPAALGKQGGNGSQGFFSAADNDNSALDLRIVQRMADESGQGEMKEFCCVRVRVCEAMKAPVGLLSNGTVLRCKMEGPRPDKVPEKKNAAHAVQAKDFVGVKRRQNESGVLQGGTFFLGNHPLKVVVITVRTTTFRQDLE